jgi:site-specific DNA-adenine methylase
VESYIYDIESPICEMDIAVRDWRETLAAADHPALVLTDPPYGTTNNKCALAIEHMCHSC